MTSAPKSPPIYHECWSGPGTPTTVPDRYLRRTPPSRDDRRSAALAIRFLQCLTPLPRRHRSLRGRRDLIPPNRLPNATPPRVPRVTLKTPPPQPQPSRPHRPRVPQLPLLRPHPHPFAMSQPVIDVVYERTAVINACRGVSPAKKPASAALDTTPSPSARFRAATYTFSRPGSPI